MKTIITPSLKDDILNDFISQGMSFATSFHENSLKFDTTFKVYEAIVKQFEEMNLLECDRMLGGNAFINLTAYAHDFYNRGGFQAQEEILKANINKLGLELEKLSEDLEPKFAQRANTLSAIAANIVTALGLFRG